MADLERTEQATSRKRQQERAKGNVARSRDVVAAISLCFATLMLLSTAKSNALSAADVFVDTIGQGFVIDQTNYNFGREFTSLLFLALRKLAGIFLAVLLAGAIGNILQTGFLFLPQKTAPDFQRINPNKNLRQLFSFTPLLQTSGGLVKTFLFSVLLFLAIRRDLENFTLLPFGTPIEVVLFFSRFISRIAYQYCALAILLAVVDYALKRWKYEHSIKMTVQELRDEIKEESGSPVTKSKRQEARSVLLNHIAPTEPVAPIKPIFTFQPSQKNAKKKKE